jgi:hypothetical protein
MTSNVCLPEKTTLPLSLDSCLPETNVDGIAVTNNSNKLAQKNMP